MNKMIVISYDAFSEDNWERAKALPNLKKIIEAGSYTNQLLSVYPTLTYVVHTTMMTGKYPISHGVYHNNPLQPFVKEADQEWFWYRSQVQAETIYDLAKKYKKRVAGILWPVTGKSSIRYNIPEVRAIQNENQIWKALKSGTAWYSILMEMKHGHLRQGISQPGLDDFSTACACTTIRKYKPDLMLLHLTDLDDTKHHHHLDSKEVDNAICRMDRRIGEIVRAVEEAGLEKEMHYVVIGDHGQKEVHYQLRMNRWLQEILLQNEDEHTWKSYIQGADGTAFWYFNGMSTEEIMDARNRLEQWREHNQGIRTIFTKDEMRNMGIDSSAEFMIEAHEGYYFSDETEKSTVIDLNQENITHSTHGYLPDQEGYHCNFVIAGPKVKTNYHIGKMNMVDVAPTLANVLDFEMDSCDGRQIDEIML